MSTLQNKFKALGLEDFIETEEILSDSEVELTDEELEQQAEQPTAEEASIASDEDSLEDTEIMQESLEAIKEKIVLAIESKDLSVNDLTWANTFYSKSLRKLGNKHTLGSFSKESFSVESTATDGERKKAKEALYEQGKLSVEAIDAKLTGLKLAQESIVSDMWGKVKEFFNKHFTVLGKMKKELPKLNEFMSDPSIKSAKVTMNKKFMDTFALDQEFKGVDSMISALNDNYKILIDVLNKAKENEASADDVKGNFQSAIDKILSKMKGEGVFRGKEEFEVNISQAQKLLKTVEEKISGLEEANRLIKEIKVDRKTSSAINKLLSKIKDQLYGSVMTLLVFTGIVAKRTKRADFIALMYLIAFASISAFGAGIFLGGGVVSSVIFAAVFGSIFGLVGKVSLWIKNKLHKNEIGSTDEVQKAEKAPESSEIAKGE